MFLSANRASTSPEHALVATRCSPRVGAKKKAAEMAAF
jgi:hypothetical protein